MKLFRLICLTLMPAPAPSVPSMISTFGMFLLSANSFSTDGRCMEIAVNLPADPAEAAQVRAEMQRVAGRQAGP